MPHRRIFVYGTLQFPAIAEAVTGRRLASARAWLEGYARFQIKDAPYPGIAPRPNASVEGLVYEDVDPAALERIDTFEGEMYRRVEVTVTREDAAAVAAQTYVVRPRWRVLLREADWDPNAFAREWHETYVRACIRHHSAGSLP